MKKKTNARTLIRGIVREEVALAIKEVIKELKQPTQQVSKLKPKKKIIEKKKYSNNSILNDVLNETANTEEYKTMGGGTFDSSRMNDVVGKSYGDMMNDTSQPNANIAREMGVDPNDPANSFLTKDYRKVMKAIDKKQGQGK